MIPEDAVDVLNDGISFVRLVDHMGGDDRIVQAARVSNGAGTKTKRTDEKLIQYLVKNRHTSPLEKVRFEFHARMPIFVARQWIRHRTGSYNEESARYSIMQDDFYVPALGRFKLQSASNKQASADELVEDPVLCQAIVEDTNRFCYNSYQRLLKQGLARELARIVLPVSLYTQWYWTTDLHNLMGFLSLRLDPHAQEEIREYAKVLKEYAYQVAPVAMAAWEDNQIAWAKYQEWRENENI